MTMDLGIHNTFKSRAINQYMPPLCFELAGQKLTLLMDDGYDMILNFIDGQSLEWNIVGDKPKTEKYSCMKADNTTYMVYFEVENSQLRTNYLFVIDRENDLVTREIAVIGENPRWPYLLNTKFEFGAIEKEGQEYKSYPRHGYTSDLIGNVLEWTYSSDMTTVHIYHCAHFYRITYPNHQVNYTPDPNDEAAMSNYAISMMLRSLPSRDEPTTYIKIKEGMYLVSLTEANTEKLLTGQIMFRSNNLTLLQNYKRVFQIGRAFGTSTLPEGDTKTNIAFAAFGRLLDPTEERFAKLLSDPNPFIV